MDGVAKLKAFAKQQRRRTTYGFGDANVPEPMVRSLSFSRGTFKVKLAASAAYFRVSVRIESPVVFSVGRDDVFFTTAELTTELGESGAGIFVPLDTEYWQLRQPTIDWLTVSENRAAVDALCLGADDSVHVVANEVCLIVSAGRELDDRLFDPFMALAGRIDSPSPSKGLPPEDVEALPEPLRAVVLRFASLAEGDDELRGEMTAKMSKKAKKTFVDAMWPLMPAIDDYLDTLAHDPPMASLVLSELAELASELGLEFRLR